MKKQVTLEIETTGKNMDPAFEQSVLEAVEKGLQATAFTVTIKAQAPAAPAAPVEPAPAV